MKTELKFVALAGVFGFGMWILDGVIDYIYFHDMPFWELLIFKIPPHELYMRSVMMLNFVIFGLVVSKIYIKRKKSEQALKESEELLRAIGNAITDIMFVIDEDGRYIEVLTSSDNLLYKNSSDIKGRLIRDIFPEEKANIFIETIQNTITTGNPQVLEYELDVPKGQRWFEGRTAPLSGLINGKRAAVWDSRDITNRKKNEEEKKKLIFDLQSAADRIKTLSGLLPICAWCKKIKDDQGAWNHLENYISKHSNADFTHSICPECRQKEVAKRRQ